MALINRGRFAPRNAPTLVSMSPQQEFQELGRFSFYNPNPPMSSVTKPEPLQREY
jgi:hypothetical protein